MVAIKLLWYLDYIGYTFRQTDTLFLNMLEIISFIT